MLIVYLIVLGILAGIVSSVASMASLVSYPGLLLVGLSPVVAKYDQHGLFGDYGLWGFDLLPQGNERALAGTGLVRPLPALRGGHWGLAFVSLSRRNL